MNTMKARLLITGASGLLGGNLCHYFKDNYEVLGLYHAHPVAINGVFSEKCDLTDQKSVKEIVSCFKPAVVVHCASLTNVDQCEVEHATTNKVNVLSTQYLVESLGADTRFIYVSTDAVYDGREGNFREDEQDRIRPRNYYGLSKHAGELEAQKSIHSLILRTNMFGWNLQDKKSLGEWILEELRAGRTIQCFKDAFFSSIYTLELARVIDIALQHDLKGVYNCGSSDSCSKYSFALKIAECFALDKLLIKAISIDDHNFRAERGKNLSLSVNKLQTALDYKLPTIDQSIEAFYRDYKCGLPGEMRIKIVCEQNPKVIPYGRQSISDNDIRSVVNVLRSSHLTQGPVIPEFEKSLTDYCGARYGVAMNSGTSVLHAACLAAHVGPGDEVITSPITFVASANCAVYCRATPVFADIDPKTYNISPDEISKKITPKTKAIIPVHFAGQSCDMASIQEIVRGAEKKYNQKIYIIEDACHALGSRYKNGLVGSCLYSDMTVMSFHPVKHITTGEGGVVLTNDETLYKRLRQFRSHGITSTPEDFVNIDLAYQSKTADTQLFLNPWYYEQIDLGYNYRITDIQSALGLSQMSKLEMFRMRRKEIVSRYHAAFKNTAFVTIPFEEAHCNSNFHLYVLLFDFENMKTDRARFMLTLKSSGIQTQVHYIPVHLQPYYRKHFGTKPGDCPNAEGYYQKCLSIPLFPSMSDHDVDTVVNNVSILIKETNPFFVDKSGRING